MEEKRIIYLNNGNTQQSYLSFKYDFFFNLKWKFLHFLTKILIPE